MAIAVKPSNNEHELTAASLLLQNRQAMRGADPRQ